METGTGAGFGNESRRRSTSLGVSTKLLFFLRYSQISSSTRIVGDIVVASLSDGIEFVSLQCSDTLKLNASCQALSGQSALIFYKSEKNFRLSFTFIQVWLSSGFDTLNSRGSGGSGNQNDLARVYPYQHPACYRDQSRVAPIRTNAPPEAGPALRQSRLAV
jgi:hypothetical protein